MADSVAPAKSAGVGGDGSTKVELKSSAPSASSTASRFGNPDNWSFMDTLSFSWQNKIVPAARKGDVTVQDLPLPRDQMSQEAYDLFNTNWEEHVAQAKADGVEPSLKKVLLKTYGKEMLRSGVFKMFWTIFLIMGAYFFTRSILMTIRTLEGKDKSIFDAEWKGWVLTGFFFIDAWLLGLMLQRMGYGCLTTGIKARAALTSTVARKCFNMAHLTSEAAASAVALVATDINKIFEGFQEVHYLWGAPIEAALILALLATLVGVYSLPGVAVVCMIVPAQYVFGFMIIKNKIKNNPNVVERYAVIQEILPAMKLVKYYAWERFFEKHITTVRAREMKFMIKNAIVKTINVAMVFGVPPIVTFVVLVPYETTNEADDATEPYITPQTAFTMLSLFNVLRFPLVVLPKALRCVSEAMNSVDKLERFLAIEGAPKHDVVGKPGVEFKQAVFHHDGREDFNLVVPEFTVKPGELIGIAGRVGAGKSSLLQAIMGNMHQLEGHAHAGGQMAYVPQNPWCQNLSLRDNILFGKTFEQNKYDDVIHACALELDLQILQFGDQSKAGLRGINLSGGQRQRLNLARCAYFDGDLVLLDNALSAVDHHTAQHIFDKCVKGLFRDKATILVTHQVEFLPRCDKVAIMDAGKVLYFGPWNEKAQTLLSKFLPASHVLAAAGNAEPPREVKPKKKEEKKDGKDDKAAAPKTKHSASLPTSSAIWEFLWEARWTVFFASLFFFMSAQISRQLADYFIRWWTRDHFDKYAADCTGFCGPWFYVTFYAILGLACFLTLMIFRGAFLFIWALGASERIHKKSIHRVLYAPLGFFFSTPVGDLLVSYTKDQDVLDEALPDALYYAGIYCLIMVATTITVSITIPLFSAMAGALLLVTMVMLFLYIPAATHLKKLRMGTAGDLVTLIAESLDGLGVIQAYNQQPYFVHTTRTAIDDAHRALFGAETLNLWLAFFCDFYGAVMVLSVACLGMGMWSDLGSSSVGLAFSQSIQMLVFYTWSVRLLAESLGLFGSVEKLTWLANHTPQEGGRLAPPALRGQDKSIKRGCCAAKDYNNTRGISLTEPSADQEAAIVEAGHPRRGSFDFGHNRRRSLDVAGPEWPRTGSIVFENVVMKYAPHLPPALRGVSFSIKPRDKVGVVGRTGSGKSTLLLALYRMFNLESGFIKVDGVDIATLSLPRLRRALSIIPQEPVVFSGTVRTNLDPFTEFGDDACLWDVLKKVGLDEQSRGVGGLDGRIDGTQGWSIGQQQLMCLARAALKKVPILCLDEATAAMDPHTEELVLRIIEKLFVERTTLTIAHRLDNVIRSDQVVVMNAGVVEEMSPPSVLLADRTSAFSQLVDKTGEQGAAALRQIAADFFEQRVAEGHTN